VNKFNFDKEKENIEKYLLKEYQDLMSIFITFMFENEITIEELKKITKETKTYKDFKLTKKYNSILLEKDSHKIELNYAPENTYENIKNEKENKLIPIKKDSIIDICYINNNRTLLYSSNKKEMHLNKEIKALYSPTEENWTLTKNIEDDFYDKYIYINHPQPQFHFIRENKNNSLYKTIYISDKENFGIEYFENKKSAFGKVIKSTCISDTGLLRI
tara:strand:- start:142 stop:792 length:651 start_codon:yes stop_codon:yes gene_type:complete